MTDIMMFAFRGKMTDGGTDNNRQQINNNYNRRITMVGRPHKPHSQYLCITPRRNLTMSLEETQARHKKEIKALDGEKRSQLKKTKQTAGKGKKAKDKLAE